MVLFNNASFDLLDALVFFEQIDDISRYRIARKRVACSGVEDKARFAYGYVFGYFDHIRKGFNFAR
jgi:hypothetical protein